MEKLDQKLDQEKKKLEEQVEEQPKQQEEAIENQKPKEEPKEQLQEQLQNQQQEQHTILKMDRDIDQVTHATKHEANNEATLENTIQTTVETTNESKKESVDYAKVYDKLTDRFNQAYNESQALHLTEKAQRQTLYHYKRRNNALIDFLRSFDDGTYELLENERMMIDASRIENLISFQPALADTLNPILKLARGDPPETIHLDSSYEVNLIVDELIPELPNDELDAAELNPQELEMWTRRNFSHLVVSKFKPADVRAKGVREYVDSAANNMKRRKRKDI